MAQHFKLSGYNSSKEDGVEHLKFMSNIPYSQGVGSLLYLMISTMPNISYSASLVSRYMANREKRHWEATKWMLRYLKGTQYAKLSNQQIDNQPNEVCGYVDSDYVEDLDKRILLSDNIFMFGGNVVSLKANLQFVVALSSIEAEFIALSETIKEGLWLK